MRPQPLICVSDVEASSRWYQHILNCTSAHGGPNYERLEAAGKLVLQLHRWDVDHHHGPIGDPAVRPPGNGLLLWFEVDDFDAAISRVEAVNAEIIMARHRNPPEGDGGRITGKSGFAIRTVTKWFWRAPTEPRTAGGNRENLSFHVVLRVRSSYEEASCQRSSGAFLKSPSLARLRADDRYGRLLREIDLDGGQ